MGYEAIREQILARQKELGIVLHRASPGQSDPHPQTRPGPDGKPFPEVDYTKPWDSLKPDEKRLFCRMAEVYAGFLGPRWPPQPLLHHRGPGGHPRRRRPRGHLRHGARFSGRTLYVKDNRLHYVHNFVGITEQRVDATEDLPTGQNLILSASFTKDRRGIPRCRHRHPVPLLRRPQGRRGPHQDPTEQLRTRRRGTMHRPGQRRRRHRRLPGQRPYRFAGGAIKRVVVDVSGDPSVDLEREAEAMLARE